MIARSARARRANVVSTILNSKLRSAVKPVLEQLEGRCLLSGVLSGAIHWNVSGKGSSIAVADFNRDGASDLAATFSAIDELGISLANGSGGLILTSGIPAGDEPAFITAGDFNADGNPDLAYARSDPAGILAILIGDGAGAFAPGGPVTIDPAVTKLDQLRTGDFNGDGNQDLAGLTLADSYVSTFLGNGAGGFAFEARFLAGTDINELVAADFNGDLKSDLAAADLSGSILHVFIRQASGTFTEGGYGGSARRLAVGDVNGDGHIDIVGSKDSEVTVFIGDGAGSFGTSAAPIVTPFPADDLTLADFDDDGKLDLVTTYTSGVADLLPITLSLGDGYGGFTPTQDVLAGRTPFQPTAADFNRDGQLDLLVQNTTGASVMLNTTPAVPPPPPPTLAINDVSVSEGNAGTVDATFTVTRSGNTSGASDVLWSTANSSAVAPGDYTAVGSTPLHFAAGETSKQVTVLVKGDTLPESAENFLVNLASPVGATISDGQGVGTIIDDEARLSLTGRTDLKTDKKGAFTGVVASFTSADFASASKFAATINWGDGTSSAGQIVWNTSTSRWDIIATHKYAKRGRFVLLVTLADANGSTAQANSLIAYA